MEEGDFNLSNLNVVANQIASEIEEEQTKVSQTEAPQQQIEDVRFSWTDDSIEVKNIGMHESRGEIADDSINYSADDEDQNYDPLLDEKLKATCFVKPTLNEHPSQAESSSTPYQEVELDENYCNGYVSSMRLVINPDSGSSDDEETSNQKNVDNNGSETTPVKVPDDNKPENNGQDNKTENANGNRSLKLRTRQLLLMILVARARQRLNVKKCRMHHVNKMSSQIQSKLPKHKQRVLDSIWNLALLATFISKFLRTLPLTPLETSSTTRCHVKVCSVLMVTTIISLQNIPM